MSTTITISKKYKKAQIASIVWIVIFFITLLLSCILSVFLLGLSGYAAYLLLSYLRLSWLSILGAVGLVILGVLIVYFNIKFILSFFKNYDDYGIEITPSDEPELFNLINETVKQVGTKFPKRVFLIEDVNASVFYSNNIQSLFLPTPKNLNIGMGLLHMLTVEELKGILSHEFGHFSQKSMTIGNYVGNINRSIYQVLYNHNSVTSIVEDLAHWNALVSFICRGAILYTDMISYFLKKIYQNLEIQNLALSREMEFNADEIAVSVVGYQTYEKPLLRIGFYTICFNEAKDLYAKHCDENLFTKNIYNNYNQVVNYRMKLDNITTYKDLADVKLNENSFEELRIEYEDLWSSHPGIKDRLDKVKLLNLNSKEDLTSKATSLINHLQGYEESLTEDLFINSQIFRKNEIFDYEFYNLLISDDNQYTYAKEYHGFFNENDFDFNQFLKTKNSNGNNLSFNDIFNAKNLEPIYKQNRAYREINLVNNLALQKEYKQVKFKDQIYNLRKETDTLCQILNNEASSYQPSIDKINEQVVNYFQANLDENKMNKLKIILEEETKLLSNITFAQNFAESLNWLFKNLHSKIILDNLKDVHEKNEELKTRLKDVIDSDRLITFYTQDQIEQLKSYINIDQLFYVEGYNENEVNDLFYAINMIQGISSTLLFDYKNQFLREFIPVKENILV